MKFKNKVILLISSEKWGKIFISKHHYALTLAELDNTVYFLNPVEFSIPRGTINIEASEQNKNLLIVTFRPFFPWFLKFHAKLLFQFLMKLQIDKILKKIKKDIDIVWDFNCSYLFNELSIFKASIEIFHPVDMLDDKAAFKKADIIFSVSQQILNDYKVLDIPKFLINHGLSKEFIELANQCGVLNTNRVRKKICYIGNLLIPSLDRSIIKEIIVAHPALDFIFIGPYEKGNNNIISEYKAVDNEFVNYLKRFHNVILLGVLNCKEIVECIADYDAFLLCYKNSQSYRCDNSHKILEYLSTGKVVISTPVSFYRGLGLIEMSDEKNEFHLLFNKVINNLDHYNSPQLIKKRKDFAKCNSYEKHVKEIELLINRSIIGLPDKLFAI